MGSGVGQFVSERGESGIGQHPSFFAQFFFIVQCFRKCDSSQFDQHGLGHSFSAVSCHGVGDFVGDHRCQLRVVIQIFEQSIVHRHLAAGQTESVGGIRGKGLEFPRETRLVDDVRDVSTDTFDGFGIGRVGRRLFGLFNFVPCLHPELGFGLGVGQDQLTSSGQGFDGGASGSEQGDKGSGGQGK